MPPTIPSRPKPKPSWEPVPHPATSDEKIWHPNPTDDDRVITKEPSVTLYEGKGNGFHLAAVVRKYTAARVQIKYGYQMVQIETAKLYDALGLLRSLQYDVAQFNQIDPTTTPKNLSKYWSFRLSRQASAFGVRIPRISNDINDTDNDNSNANQERAVVVPGLDELIRYIESDECFGAQIAMARANIERGIVDFDSLQEYFVPGQDYVDSGIATGLAVPTLMRSRACYYQRGKSLFGTVSTFYVAMEVTVAAMAGETFLVVESQFPQSEFRGTRSIHDSLDMFCRPKALLLERLVDRGRRYEEICGTKAHTGSGIMVEYTAGTFLAIGQGKKSGSYSQASRSGGRMMVDTEAAWARGIHCAKNNGIASDVVVSSLKWFAQKQTQLQASSDSTTNKDGNQYSTGTSVSNDADEGNEILVLKSPLPDTLIALTWPVVPGFSLKARTWGNVMVHGTKAVQFNEAAFQSLVMDQSRKKLIQALVTSHQKTSSKQQQQHKSADLIAGKGEGSIFLLHGPPGVGKTLTAEAIAEMLHKPLYVVSMGELGTTPETLEERLNDILDLCIPWKALVLIDEAEMLLERRSKHDIVRNAMVCVMLRLLEYYSGILFLTTNRVESLDPAFQSRVTCALRYDKLSKASRKEIWHTMLTQRLGIDIEASEINIDQLANHELNGRQIKNTLQLAMALADHDGSTLTPQHLQTTIDITTSFLDATTTSGEADS